MKNRFTFNWKSLACMWDLNKFPARNFRENEGGCLCFAINIEFLVSLKVEIKFKVAAWCAFGDRNDVKQWF